MSDEHTTRAPNRLIHETSPYLLQHAYNPVDWFPWGAEALDEAKRLEKPILLSIGYSACHWCHVMERESFENEQIAALMNEHFVNIKVDREERPDLDHIYQTAGQLLTGQGGWPLTVFLTPDQRPFYAGTYFPPDDRFGRPGFARVIQSLVQTYREDPDRVERAAKQLTDALREVDRRHADETAAVPPEDGPQLVAKAAEWLSHHADSENGGFGSAPKFPNASALELFQRVAARQMEGADQYLHLAELALTKMALGGIYDHLGGGFHRYSVDAEWQVPHFEKMLYDNALLPPLYLQAYQFRKEPKYERVVHETLRYVMREMSHPDGGFYSTQDADSEGEEGKFFVWRPGEITEVLGSVEGELLCEHFGVTESGNFEGGATVLRIAKTSEELADAIGQTIDEMERRLQEGKAKLLEARERRVKPGRDEKVITGWNALMISAFARAYDVLRTSEYLERATKAARFIQERLVERERLLRSYKGKASGIRGYLEDYAYWVAALLDLYEASLNREYLDDAHGWMNVTLELFYDETTPGFFMVPKDEERLIHRPKDWRDQSTPSGTGVAVHSLLRLHAAFEGEGYRSKAEAVLKTHKRQLDQNPWGTASLLLAYDAVAQGGTEVVVVAREDQHEKAARFAEVVGEYYLPHRVLHVITPQEADKRDAPLLWQGKRQQEGQVTAYVCRGYQCSRPVTEPHALKPLLEGTRFGKGSIKE